MRIVILGNSGSGKSTLARRLGDNLSIPVFHMDRLYWKPGWTESSDEELRAKVDATIAGENWIIDGNYSRVLPQRLERAHVALVLEVPVWLSLWRALKRTIVYRGQTRPDMGEDCLEKGMVDADFFRWILKWPKRRPRLYALLEKHPHLDLRVLDQHYNYADLLDSLRQLRAAERAAAAQPPSDQEPTAMR